MRSLEEIMDAKKVSVGDRPGDLPRRSVVAKFTPEDGVLGIFDEDFELGVHELTVNEELRASRAAKGDGGTLGIEMAKASIATFNGEPVKVAQREWLLNHLSPRGRNKLLRMFARVSLGDATVEEAERELDAEGKASEE